MAAVIIRRPLKWPLIQTAHSTNIALCWQWQHKSLSTYRLLVPFPDFHWILNFAVLTWATVSAPDTSASGLLTEIFRCFCHCCLFHVGVVCPSVLMLKGKTDRPSADLQLPQSSSSKKIPVGGWDHSARGIRAPQASTTWLILNLEVISTCWSSSHTTEVTVKKKLDCLCLEFCLILAIFQNLTTIIMVKLCFWGVNVGSFRISVTVIGVILVMMLHICAGEIMVAWRQVLWTHYKSLWLKQRVLWSLRSLLFDDTAERVAGCPGGVLQSTQTNCELSIQRYCSLDHVGES